MYRYIVTSSRAKGKEVAAVCGNLLQDESLMVFFCVPVSVALSYCAWIRLAYSDVYSSVQEYLTSLHVQHFICDEGVALHMHTA